MFDNNVSLVFSNKPVISTSLQTKQSESILINKNKRISLETCCSSISFQDCQRNVYNKEKVLMRKYLIAKENKEKEKLLDQMKKDFQYRVKNNNCQIKQFMLQCYKDQQIHKIPNSDAFIYHYISAWLLDMGYSSKQTKKYVISRIHYLLNSSFQNIKNIQKYYQFLNLDNFSSDERKYFLLQICKNGWEYLINEYVKYIKNKTDKQKQKQEDYSNST